MDASANNTLAAVERMTSVKNTLDFSEKLLDNTSATTVGRVTSVKNTSSGDMFDAKIMDNIILSDRRENCTAVLSDSGITRENCTADACELSSSSKKCDVVSSDNNNCYSSGNKDLVTAATPSAAKLGTNCSSGKNSFASTTVPPTWSCSSLEDSFLNWDWHSVVGFFDSHQTSYYSSSYDQKQQSGYNEIDMNDGSFVESLGLGCYYPSNSYFYPSNDSNLPSTTRDCSTYYPTTDYGLEYFDGMYYSPPMNYCHPQPPPCGSGYETSAHNLVTGAAAKPYDNNCHSYSEKYDEKNQQNNHYSLNQKYYQKYQNNTYNTNNNNNKWYFQNTNNKSNFGNESFGYTQKQERFGNSSNTSSGSWTRNVNGTYVLGGGMRNTGSWDVHDGGYNNRTRNSSWGVHDGYSNRTRNNSWNISSSGPFGTRNCWRSDFDSYDGVRSDDKSSSSSSVGSSYYDESDKTERPSVWFRFPTPTTHSGE